jgi:hypothetical protein
MGIKYYLTLTITGLTAKQRRDALRRIQMCHTKKVEIRTQVGRVVAMAF